MATIAKGRFGGQHPSLSWLRAVMGNMLVNLVVIILHDPAILRGVTAARRPLAWRGEGAFYVSWFRAGASL